MIYSNLKLQKVILKWNEHHETSEICQQYNLSLVLSFIYSQIIRRLRHHIKIGDSKKQIVLVE